MVLGEKKVVLFVNSLNQGLQHFALETLEFVTKMSNNYIIKLRQYFLHVAK